MENNHPMPKEKGIDHTIQLLKEGYHFIMNRKEKFDSRVFETHLLGEKAICLVGKEEAELFYDETKFTRKDAAPSRVKKTLFGEGGVQGLDDAPHHHRKAMFMSLMTEEKLQQLKQLTKEEWEKEFRQIQDENIVVYEKAKSVLTRVAMKWVEIPVEDTEADKWSDELADMFEKAASIGPKHWKSRYSRSKMEEWMEDWIEKVRLRKVNISENAPLYQFSFHKDLDGELLDKQIVAVELLNLLRPIVAIAVYIDLLMLAMHDNKDEVAQMNIDDEKQVTNFIQEVRRFYPFFPFAAARVKETFTWNGYVFEEGTLTLLDLYGTNHDPAIWENPNQFQPSRFHDWSRSPFDFIPQGGGEYLIGHRCAGEWITVDILKTTIKFFVQQLAFTYPEKKFEYDNNDIPPLPKCEIRLRA